MFITPTACHPNPPRGRAFRCYVYVGNVAFHEGSNTYCPKCGKVVIKRVGYNTDASGLRDGGCASCGRKIPGVWTEEQALAFKPKET